jgi:hypothetical protein
VPVSLSKPPNGGFRSETATNLTYIFHGNSPTETGVRSGVNGNVTAVAVGQSQQLYSGVRMFTAYYLSSPTQIPRRPVVPLESR